MIEQQPQQMPPLAKKMRGRPPQPDRDASKDFLSHELNGKKPVCHSKPYRGKARRRSGGTLKSTPTKGGPPKIKEIQGPYVLDLIVVPQDLARLIGEAEPIRLGAKSLLVEYLKRRAFMDAVDNCGVSIDFAGKTHLQVEKRRAQIVYKETEEAGGALQWFIRKVDSGFKSGTISGGPRMSAPTSTRSSAANSSGVTATHWAT